MAYTLYLETDVNNKYEFDKSSGRSGIKTTSIRYTTSRQMLTTFGRVPYVYYGGHTNFATFDLSTIFLAQYDENTGVKTLTAREYAKKFIDMVNLRKPIIVENSQGMKIKCDVQITSDVSPVLYAEDDMEYIEISISCTEIG